MLIFGLWPCVSANIHCQLNPAMRECLRNTKFRSKRQETLMVPMLLWQGCSLQPALCFAWASPHAGNSLSAQTWAETDNCQLASRLEMCQSDIRKDLCDEVIIISIILLSPLDRYVTSHLLQEQQTAVHAKWHALLSSQPGGKTQLQPWIHPCATAMKSEDSMKTDLGEAGSRPALQRAAQRSHDSCKVLGV